MTARDIGATGPRLTASLGRQLNHAAKAARQHLDRRLGEMGGGYVVWTVLSGLATGPLIQRELADRLGIEGPTLTHHLARMEADGLVMRSRSVTDRRAAQVGLTDKGRDLYQRLAAIVAEESSRVFGEFTPEEVSTLHTQLTRIIERCDS
jgi:MarR family transcriptional regulator for hemolysin